MQNVNQDFSLEQRRQPWWLPQSTLPGVASSEPLLLQKRQPSCSSKPLAHLRVVCETALRDLYDKTTDFLQDTGNTNSGPNEGIATTRASPLATTPDTLPSSLFDKAAPSTAPTTPNDSRLELNPAAPTAPTTPPTNRSLVVNANDGGGVRAYSTLLILQCIDQRLKAKGIPEDWKPKDWMDISVGTSGGGLNTLLLAQLELSIDEAIEAMEQTSKPIFKGNFITRIYNNIRQRGPQYNPAAFEESMKAIIERVTGDKDTPLYKGEDAKGCKA
jgi:hypothetical protein